MLGCTSLLLSSLSSSSSWLTVVLDTGTSAVATCASWKMLSVLRKGVSGCGKDVSPRKALRGGISCSYLEPFVNSLGEGVVRAYLI